MSGLPNPCPTEGFDVAIRIGDLDDLARVARFVEALVARDDLRDDLA